MPGSVPVMPGVGKVGCTGGVGGLAVEMVLVVVPDAVGELVPETVLEVVGDDVPETVPEVVGEEVPETVPDTVGELVPETVPGVVESLWHPPMFITATMERASAERAKLAKVRESI